MENVESNWAGKKSEGNTQTPCFLVNVWYLLQLIIKQEKRAKVTTYKYNWFSYLIRWFSVIVGFNFKEIPVQREINSITKNKFMWNFC